jgi:hypothetical protein
MPAVREALRPARRPARETVTGGVPVYLEGRVPCLWAHRARSGQRSACRAVVGACVALKEGAWLCDRDMRSGLQWERRGWLPKRMFRAWTPPLSDFNADRASRFGAGRLGARPRCAPAGRTALRLGYPAPSLAQGGAGADPRGTIDRLERH